MLFRKPVKLKDFEIYLKYLHKNSNMQFLAQMEVKSIMYI